MLKVQTALENELVFGAHVREQRWRHLFYIAGALLIFSGTSNVLMALKVERPAPLLVPYDVRTGTALPDVNITSVSLKQTDAIKQSLLYSYVSDRETYNHFDNDLRIASVDARSKGQAEASLTHLWQHENPDNLQKLYGDKSRIDVVITGIVLQPNNRALVHIRKRLTSANSSTDGSFVVSIGYSMEPSKQEKLDDIWKNPFGFSVTDYRVDAQQYESN